MITLIKILGVSFYLTMLTIVVLVSADVLPEEFAALPLGCFVCHAVKEIIEWIRL